MLFVFILLLPLALVPFLVEMDNRWLKRFAYLIAGVQVLSMLFRYLPDGERSTFSHLPALTEGIQLLIKTAIHIF